MIPTLVVRLIIPMIAHTLFRHLVPLADIYPQRARSMVYAWDADFNGMGGKTPGYFGWKFLESPSFDNNQIDDDDDGIIDESPFNEKDFFIDGVVTPA